MVKEKPLHPALARRGDGVCADGVFEMPTKVVFGRGVASQVGRFARELAGSRAMLVADPGVLALGIADRLAADLQDAGLTVTVFDHVQPNPRDVHCIEAADMAREASVEIPREQKRIAPVIVMPEAARPQVSRAAARPTSRRNFRFTAGPQGRRVPINPASPTRW